jgi:hypothetical protein
MNRRRAGETALLILLALLAVAGVEALAAGTPLRITAGIALLLVLPWIAASRLRPIRQSDTTGSRLSASGALTLAGVIVLGLLLTATTAGITTDRVVVAVLIFTVGLAVLGAPSEGPSSPVVERITSPVGLALVAVAVAISVFAFTLARDRALTQAREERSYAAFLVEDGDRLSVGLRNATSHAARFTVRDLRRGPGSTIRVDVPGHRSRIIPGFVAKPPSLRPIQRLTPRQSRPVKIRIGVSVDGQATGRPLELSTFAP